MAEPRPCNDCGAVPGGFHEQGCAQERCALCGSQLIGCHCVYELNGLCEADLEREYPDVYQQGPTEEMWAVYDAAVQAKGGPLPWQGEYPGSAACRTFGFWSKWVEGRGWQECSPTDEGAGEDVNRLCVAARWDATARGWVRCRDGMRHPWSGK